MLRKEIFGKKGIAAESALSVLAWIIFIAIAIAAIYFLIKKLTG